MVFLQKLNRILVSGLLVLVFIQIALLFFLKSLKEEAEFRLVKNTSSAELVCGEKQFAEENYWSILPPKKENSQDALVSQSVCRQGDCENSHLQWVRPEQDKQLHLISITTPPSYRVDSPQQAGVVKVLIKKSTQPQIIALVSRAPLEWDFQVEKGAQIEKIVIATPTTAWLNNVDKKIPLEYLPKEKMCSYPYAWEEIFNPENEFRVLVSALQKVTGLSLNSFQGAVVGREFSIPRANQSKAAPMDEPLDAPRAEGIPVRGLASVDDASKGASINFGILSEIDTSTTSGFAGEEPLVWRRAQGHVVAASFKLEIGEVVELPAKTSDALEASGQLFAVIRGRLNLWSSEKKKFTVISSPLTLPEVSRITALTYDSVNARLVIYNDDRSGEFYRYEIATEKWQLFRDGFKYHVASLFFDKDTQNLMVLTSRGAYFSSLVTMTDDGQQSVQLLRNKLAHDRKRWHWSLDKKEAQDSSQWLVKIYSPLVLSGQAQTLR